jgi:hypothetical protein
MIKRNKIAFQLFSRGGTIRHGFSIFPITIIHQELRRRDLRTQNFLFADRLTAAGKRRFTVRQTKPGVLAGVIQATNPVLVILSVGVPVGALIYAMNSESLHPLNLCPRPGRLTLDRHRYLPRIRPRPDLGKARPRTRGRSLQASHAENDLPHAGCGRRNGATAGFHLTRRMGFSPVSPWIPAVFVITAIMAVQLALTLLAKNLLARKLDNSQIFNRYIPSYPQ